MTGAAHSFSLTLGLATPVEELQRWFAHAAPGHRAIYASGWDLPRKAPAVALVRCWAEAGQVHLLSEKDAADPRRTWWWVVKAGAAAHADVRAAQDLAISARTRADQDAMLDLLRDAASARQPCPSDRAMGEALGFGRGERARKRAGYVLGTLKQAGAVEVECRGRNAARVVTIRAKGRACGRSTGRENNGDRR